MPEYYCKSCAYKTKRKSSYDKHVASKRHLDVISQEQFGTDLAQMGTILAQNGPQKAQFGTQNAPKTKPINPDAICKYCNTCFTTIKSMNRHIKYTCKKNEDEDLKELIRLLNEQNEKKDEQISTLLKNQEDMQLKFNLKLDDSKRKMQKQIDKLTKKLQINSIGSVDNSNTHTNINNNTSNSNNTQNNMINNNYNIKLLNFKDTDYSHLTNLDFKKCISDCNQCVRTLLKKVHFNDEKPENMNIYVASMKEKYVMVYEDNKWVLQNRKDTINDLYDKGEFEIDTWYSDHENECSQKIQNRYKLYQSNKKKKYIVPEQKDDIALDMYNERDRVKTNAAICNCTTNPDEMNVFKSE